MSGSGREMALENGNILCDWTGNSLWAGLVFLGSILRSLTGKITGRSALGTSGEVLVEVDFCLGRVFSGG